MSRKRNFEEQEIGKLLSMYKENVELLNASFTNSVTIKKRRKKWGEITNAVNAVGKQNRTTEEIKHKWKDLLSRAKKDFSHRKRPQTGGGPKLPEGPFTDIVLDILCQSSPVLCGTSSGGESALDVDSGNAEISKPSTSTDQDLDSNIENAHAFSNEHTSLECSREPNSPKSPPRKKIKLSEKKPLREELHSELLQVEIRKVQVETDKRELEKIKLEKEITKLDLDIWLIQQLEQFQLRLQQQQLYMQQRLQQQQQEQTNET